jgi:putative tryptophan/tyrosine transport system substrate-binding protein
VDPGVRKLAVLVNAEYAGHKTEVANINTAAQTLGLDVSVFEIKPDEDHLAAAFSAIGKEGADALYVIGDTFINSSRVRVGSLAAQARLPTICIAREYVEAGGLLSYGASIPHLYARAAELVDKILRGTKPGDIPVEQPTRFELVVNLKTAKALGIEVPTSLLLRADEVIE